MEVGGSMIPERAIYGAITIEDFLVMFFVRCLHVPALGRSIIDNLMTGQARRRAPAATHNTRA